MLWSSAKKLYSGRGGHSGSNPNLGLTAAHSSGNGGVAHGQIADRTGIIEHLDHRFIGISIYLLKGKEQSRYDPGRACSRGCYDQSHGGVGLQYSHGSGHCFVEYLTAQLNSCGFMKRKAFGFASDQTAHGCDRMLDGGRGGVLHDLQNPFHFCIQFFRRTFCFRKLPLSHDF